MPIIMRCLVHRIYVGMENVACQLCLWIFPGVSLLERVSSSPDLAAQSTPASPTSSGPCRLGKGKTLGSVISCSLKCSWVMWKVPWFRSHRSPWCLLTEQQHFHVSGTHFFPVRWFLKGNSHDTMTSVSNTGKDGLVYWNWECYNERPHLHSWVSLRISCLAQMFSSKNFPNVKRAKFHLVTFVFHLINILQLRA